MSPLFIVGRYIINLDFLVHYELRPANPLWGDEEDRRPQLIIHMLSNSWITIYDREAVNAGFPDGVIEVDARLRAAFEASNTPAYVVSRDDWALDETATAAWRERFFGKR